MSCKGLATLRAWVIVLSVALGLGLFIYGIVIIKAGSTPLGITLMVVGVLAGLLNAGIALAVIDVFNNLVKNTKNSADNALINASETKELRILVTKLSDELEDLKRTK